MPKKGFPIENILTVYTGRCMKAGVGCAQDVFDHLYPGIMTLGCAAMQPRARVEIRRQLPWLETIGEPTDDAWDGVATCDRLIAAAKEIGGAASFEIEGPILDGPPTGLGLEFAEIARIKG